jgi:hypothetical protein
MCKIKTTSNVESLQVPIGNGGRFERNIKRRQTDVEIGANLVGCEDLTKRNLQGFSLRQFRGSTESAKRGKSIQKKTYNSRYSLVVTHPTTNLPI